MTSKGSMKILRRLPEAPAPTKAVRVNSQTIDPYMDIDNLEPVTDDEVEKQTKKMPKVGDAGRLASIEKARKRAEPVIKLYKDGSTTREISEATGIPERTVRGIIGRYIKNGELQITPTKTERLLAELYNSGKSYKEMQELVGLSSGSLSSKLYRLRKIGLIGKREQ